MRDPALVDLALEALVGPALLLDGARRIVHATPGARALADSLGGKVALELRAGIAAELAGATLRPLPLGRGRAGWLVAIEPRARRSEGTVLFHGMWTRDPGMKEAFHVAERAARRDASVLVRGETGTGKELFARAIHTLSPRSDGPFAAINCAALPGALLESELFGHVRGAFTGAVRDQPGFFRTAHRGTLFLDEIAELPLELQAKLLRVLETHTVLPVGSREPVPVDVRIVAATNTSLRRAVESGRFRADLMYRLRVVPIFLPPLRARTGDIALLVEKNLDDLNRQGGRQVLSIAPAARAALERYAWPGNVRELRSALEYAYVVGEGPVLGLRELPGEIAEPEAPVERAAAPGDEPAEAVRVRDALAKAAGHRGKAAALLGMSRVTLWRRMRALGLS